jgi:hypothetical protein
MNVQFRSLYRFHSELPSNFKVLSLKQQLSMFHYDLLDNFHSEHHVFPIFYRILSIRTPVHLIPNTLSFFLMSGNRNEHLLQEIVMKKWCEMSVSRNLFWNQFHHTVFFHSYFRRLKTLLKSIWLNVFSFHRILPDIVWWQIINEECWQKELNIYKVLTFYL